MKTSVLYVIDSVSKIEPKTSGKQSGLANYHIKVPGQNAKNCYFNLPRLPRYDAFKLCNFGGSFVLRLMNSASSHWKVSNPSGMKDINM
jgi:hypothetical protein